MSFEEVIQVRTAALRRPPLLILSDICTAAYGIGQLFRIFMYTGKQSISFYFCFTAFMLVGLWIASADHRSEPSRKTAETRWTFRWWTLWTLIDLITLTALRTVWNLPLGNERDLVNLAIVFGSTAIVLAVGWLRSRSTIFNDPMLKGWVGICLKTFPTFFLAYLMLHSFGASPDPVAMLAGLVTITVRLVIIHSTARAQGWNAYRRSLALAEYPNLISWACVCLIWLGWVIQRGRM